MMMMMTIFVVGKWANGVSEEQEEGGGGGGAVAILAEANLTRNGKLHKALKGVPIVRFELLFMFFVQQL